MMSSLTLVLYNIFEKCKCSTVKPRFTDTRLLWTPIITDSLLCPWGKKALIINSTLLIWYDSINTDTFYASLSVLIRDGPSEKLWGGGIFEPQEFFFVIKFLV